ncbi:MAG: hypothetical protein EZS28_038731 [Streblomastix strix]|uniref:Uncharacterized protein n=1 Tax=Streblomastix strix TaxID=222440 RepID=A0A5J4U708_9EUKA|nr:MAG: hypothetical protein EZS28_038731 [Streblomastix strix]
MKIVKERICQLIHLNCPPDINCQYCINVPQSPAIQELKSAVFKALFDASNNGFDFQDILVNDLNIVPHLTHPLIQFASQSQLDKNTDSQEQHDQQQTESSPSLSLITQSLNLLSSVIGNNNNNNICNVVINTSNALHSFYTLTNYKINIHFSQEIDNQTFKVRSSSRRCLRYIQYSGDTSVHTELVNANYVRVLVIAISTASGSGEEQDLEIYWGLDKISDFIRCLNKGRNDYEPSFPPQPLLARRSDEQIEEEGGNEEVESQLINKGFNGDIKTDANRAKIAIQNIFIKQGKPRPY